ncbi:MAG: SGNH/GDSL hydrolase family protein [Planctomycetaceae bacterium]|nr:SGNH/GDSL hydrolase family protein [Planctomycetaceae bacterium]
MLRQTFLALAAPLLVAPWLASTSAADAPFEFKDNDRVVVLGGAFIERLQTHGYLETAITAGLPNKNLTFRNLGWSGDTVWGDSRGVFGNRAEGFKRLVGDVNIAKPTLLVICYGENEAYAGEGGLADFRGGLSALLDALKPTNARVLLLGPRKHEKLGPPLPDPAQYNSDLRKYTEVIAAVARERGHAFIDLFDLPGKTENGLHLTAAGEQELVEALLPKLGVPTVSYSTSELAPLRTAIREKNELFFHRHRPQNETYLFLFRKHEQGNNAVEIRQFDPLIEAKEKEIAKLKMIGR